MKNNICILFIFLLSFGIVPVVNAFESPIYSLNMDVNVEGINVNIDSDIEFNITTNETRETASTSNSPGSIIYTNSLSGSSRNKKVLTDNLNTTLTEKRDTINLNYDTGSGETAFQKSMGTGTIIAGISYFVKSGTGFLVLSVLAIVSISTVIVLLKNKQKINIY